MKPTSIADTKTAGLSGIKLFAKMPNFLRYLKWKDKVKPDKILDNRGAQIEILAKWVKVAS